MDYVCVHCDHSWTVDDDETPQRCPSCMRATGVERAGRAAETLSKSPAKKRRWLGLLVAVLALGALAAVFVMRRSASVDGPPPLRPLTSGELKARLAREQIDAGEMGKLLEADASIEAFAEKAAAKAGEGLPRAQAIHEALRARARASAFVSWSLAEPRESSVMTAAQTLKAISTDGAKKRLYPIEVAALAVAALRSEAVPAMLAELIDVPQERAPLDAAGYLGYFVVAIYPKEVGQGAPTLFDPYAGRELGSDAKFQVLDDVTAIGAALSLRAVHEVAYLGDPRAALESSSSALRLAAKLPSVRTARGIIVLGGKMVEQGLQEFEAARQLRADAVRLHNLASAALLAADADKADQALRTALEKAPDFAGAHATLAALYMLRDEMDEGKRELDKAEKLSPDLSLVQWAYAEYFMRLGDREAALARGERAFESHPSFDAKLRYAVLLRQAGRYEPMRKLAHEIVDGSPAYRKSELKELIGAVLGPTALDPVVPDPSADDLSDLGGENLDLKLGSKQLEGPNAASSAAPGAEDPAGPLILGADPSKLRLRGGSEKLKLELDQ
jgi:tetratricopeptide (TPR) repeat protein